MKWKFWNRKAEEAKKPLNEPGNFVKDNAKPEPETLRLRDLHKEMARIDARILFSGNCNPEEKTKLDERMKDLCESEARIQKEGGRMSEDEQHEKVVAWLREAGQAIRERDERRRMEHPAEERKPTESDLRFERIRRRHEKIALDEDALVAFFASEKAGSLENCPLLQFAKLREMVEKDPGARKIEKRIIKRARKLAKKERGRAAAEEFDKNYESASTIFPWVYVPAREVEGPLKADGAFESRYMQDPAWKEVMRIGGKDCLDAHGTGNDGEGLLRFVNIVLEGRTRSGRYGALTHSMGRTDPVVSECGTYGPYYVVITNPENEMVRPGPNRGYIMPEELHSAYLVPRDSEKEMVIEAVFKAVEQGIVTRAEAVGALARLVTYKEFVDAPYGVFYFVFREGATLSEDPSEEERAAWDFFSKKAGEIESRFLSRSAGN